MVFKSIIKFFSRKKVKEEIKKETNFKGVIKEKKLIKKPVEEEIKEVEEGIKTKVNERIKARLKKETARVIALANQKGGVGKSTTAINMSASLTEMGENIVLIDVDPQANTTSGLGVNKYEVDKSIYDAIIGKANIKELVLNTSVEGLSLIPSNINLAGAEIELVNMMMREYRLRKVIEPIRNNYDFIIIDCPPALGILTINALVAADEVIVPIQCEYYALEGLGQLMKTIELVKNNLNNNLEISGFVMTMYDSRTKLASQVVEEVKRYFGEKVYKTIIPRNVRVSEAPSYGLPVIFYDPYCKGSLAYKNFAKEVINHGKKRIGEGT
jgi:chromosome partitioning protein